MKKKSKPSCLECSANCKRTTAKFCSRECYLKNWKRYRIHYGGAKRQLKGRKCLCCQKIFRPIRNTSKFCSRKCSGRYRHHAGDLVEFVKKGRYAASHPSPSTRAKLAAAMSRRNKGRGYTKGIGGTRKDLGHYVRSRWEANICRLLKHVNVQYLFEPDTFKLQDQDNRYTYTPDIKIAAKIYIEVKGWETPKAKIKRKLMLEQYPDIEIIYICETEYKELSKIAKDVIPNWECDKNHGR